MQGSRMGTGGASAAGLDAPSRPRRGAAAARGGARRDPGSLPAAPQNSDIMFFLVTCTSKQPS